MKRIRLGSTAGIGVMVAAAVVAVGVTRASAQGNVLYACANPGNGDLRLVDAGQACHANETRVQWNVVGSQGPQGPQGPQGAAGAQGPAGPAGPSGTSGQSSVTVLSSEATFLDPDNGVCTRVQGLGAPFTTTDTSYVYVAADGGMQAEGLTTFSTVAFTLRLDGIDLQMMPPRTFMIVNPPNESPISNFAFSTALPFLVPAGQHVIEVCAQVVNGGAMLVADFPFNPRSAELTVLVLNR